MTHSLTLSSLTGEISAEMFITKPSLPDTMRRKSCPAYLVNASSNILLSPLPASDKAAPMRSRSTCIPPIPCKLTTNEHVKSKRFDLKNRFDALEDDLKKACAKLKKVGCNVKEKLSPTKHAYEERATQFQHTPKRTLLVLSTKNANKKKHPSLEDLLDADVEFENNIALTANPMLTLASLANGCFAAVIELKKFPIGGTIIIRISGFKLDFYWTAQHTALSNKRLAYSTPVYCNAVDIPMYVNTESLQLTLTADNIIEVSGKTKVFLEMRNSISSEDLALKKILKTTSRDNKAADMIFRSLSEQHANCTVCLA